MKVFPSKESDVVGPKSYSMAVIFDSSHYIQKLFSIQVTIYRNTLVGGPTSQLGFRLFLLEHLFCNKPPLNFTSSCFRHDIGEKNLNSQRGDAHSSQSGSPSLEL